MAISAWPGSPATFSAAMATSSRDYGRELDLLCVATHDRGSCSRTIYFDFLISGLTIEVANRRRDELRHFLIAEREICGPSRHYST